MEPSESPAETLSRAQVLLERALADDSQLAAILAHDLHAIQRGENTIGTYDMLTWVQVRSLLSGLSREDLEALIGPAATP